MGSYSADAAGKDSESPVGFLEGFSAVWLTYALVLLPSSLLLVMNWLSHAPMDSLFDSRATPWGVFTAVFVHSDLVTDLAPNLGFLFLYTLVFVLTNQDQEAHERRVRSKVFAASVVLSAVAANWVWLVATALQSYGSSGAVFGAVGATTGFALYNVFPATRGDRCPESRFVGGGWLSTLSNEVVFLGLFLQLLFAPNSLLGPGILVNGFVHGVALLVSFLVCAAFMITRNLRAE